MKPNEPQGRTMTANDNLLKVLLVVCWGLVLAKAGFIVLATKTPTYVELAYIVALPTVLWNLKRGRELLGTYFYVGLLAAVGVAAVAWTGKEWMQYAAEESESLRSLGWVIGKTILALNFMVLLYFVAKELVLTSKPKEPVVFQEPSTHPSPQEEKLGSV